jgi:hypothetical protein
MTLLWNQIYLILPVPVHQRQRGDVKVLKI